MYVITCVQMYALACKNVQAVSRSRPHSTLQTVIALTYVHTYVRTYACAVLCICSSWKSIAWFLTMCIRMYVLCTYVHTSLNMWLTGVVMNCAGVSGWAWMTWFHIFCIPSLGVCLLYWYCVCVFVLDQMYVCRCVCVCVHVRVCETKLAYIKSLSSSSVLLWDQLVVWREGSQESPCPTQCCGGKWYTCLAAEWLWSDQTIFYGVIVWVHDWVGVS